MDLGEIRERLIKAQKNRDNLEQQFKHTQGEIERLNILRIKWAGVCDYFESLLPENAKPIEPVTFHIKEMTPHIQN